MMEIRSNKKLNTLIIIILHYHNSSDNKLYNISVSASFLLFSPLSCTVELNDNMRYLIIVHIYTTSTILLHTRFYEIYIFFLHLFFSMPHQSQRMCVPMLQRRALEDLVGAAFHNILRWNVTLKGGEQ